MNGLKAWNRKPVHPLHSISEQTKSAKGWQLYAITSRKDFPVIFENSTWRHCAEIPKVLESKLVTYRELARWLSEGNGEVKDDDVVYSNCNYYNYQENNPIKDSLLVRKWDETEWHKPTREYFGLED